MACNPPYANGTGGWCNCNCKCIRPCGNYVCCVSSITFNYRIINMNIGPQVTCPEFNYVVPFTLTTDGCCFNLFELYNNFTCAGPLSGYCRNAVDHSYSLMEIRVVGSGTLTMTPGKYIAPNCHLGLPCDYDIPESNTIYATIQGTASPFICKLDAGDPDGTPLTCAVQDGDGFSIYFNPSASWPGTCCCSGGVDGYTIGEDIGNGSCAAPFISKRQKLTNLKNNVFSRIKKVHHKS